MLIFKAQQQAFSCWRFLMEGILLMVGRQGLNSLWRHKQEYGIC